MEEIQADQKLWNIPEVVERLFSLLDPASALCLVQSRLLSKDILQKSLSSKAWREIIKRISRDENDMISETEEVTLGDLEADGAEGPERTLDSSASAGF